MIIGSLCLVLSTLGQSTTEPPVFEVGSDRLDIQIADQTQPGAWTLDPGADPDVLTVPTPTRQGRCSRNAGLTPMLKCRLGGAGVVGGMSFPLAPVDRRLMGRTRRAELCSVESGSSQAAPARLLELDPMGARVRMLAPAGPTSVEETESLRITLADGGEVFGEAIWRTGDIIGVRRRRNTAG